MGMWFMKTKALPRYDDYIDSGVEWLGKIPAHWEVEPFRSVGSLFVKRNPGGLPILSVYREFGVILKDSRDDNHNATSLDTSNYKVITPGDLAINKMKAWQGSLGVSAFHGAVSPAYITCHLADDRVVGDYVHYLLRSKPFVGVFDSMSYGVRVGQWDLRFEDLKKAGIPLPPKPEQDRIVKFLDEKTALIDELIEKKKRQIKLLEEQKAIRINQAVTQGIVSKAFGTLNPHLSTPGHPVYTTHQDSLKPSGIEWIDDIPAGWEMVRFKFCASKLLQGWSPQCDNRLAEENEWGVVKVGCVNGGVFNPREHKSIPKNITPEENLIISEGEFLISRANSRELVGSAAIAMASPWKLMLCDKVYRCNIDPNKLNPELAVSEFMIKSSRIQIEIGANGASDSMQNISQDIVKNLWVQCGSINEQKLLVEFIRQLVKQSENVSSRIESQIQTLQTLKSTLVANVVIGKVSI